MSLKYLFLSVFSFLSFTALANGGTWLDATRIIYNQNDSSRAVKISNTSADMPYLVRSWVTPIDSSEVAKNWVVTPPLYRLNEKGSIQFKISALDTSLLPKDRESVFYFNALSIPGTPADEKKREHTTLGGNIFFATNTKIKLFYRPASLSGVDMHAEYKKIQFKAVNKAVSIINPTPFHINFTEIKVDGVNYKIERQMVAPFSTISITTKLTPNTISYRIINDFGGETPVTKINLKG